MCRVIVSVSVHMCACIHAFEIQVNLGAHLVCVNSVVFICLRQGIESGHPPHVSVVSLLSYTDFLTNDYRSLLAESSQGHGIVVGRF